MNKSDLYVEETLPDEQGYQVIFKSNYITQIIDFMQSYNGNNTIELWSKAHAETSKGFCPLAFKDKKG